MINQKDKTARLLPSAFALTPKIGHDTGDIFSTECGLSALPCHLPPHMPGATHSFPRLSLTPLTLQPRSVDNSYTV